MSTSSLELIAFPEEILERILALCVIAPLVQNTRPHWHQRPDPSSASFPAVRGRLAPLLVCKKFFRISTPLFYHTIHVTSPAQLHRLLSGALRPNVYLATYIRRLLFAGVWAEGGELLSMCNNSINLLDITLDMTQLSPGVNPYRGVRDLDAEEFCEGLKNITKSLTHLVLRKSNNIYLTQPKPKFVLGEIAKAMRNWNNLELADIAFRLSDDSGIGSLSTNPHLPQANISGQHQEGPITSLTHALITRPKLRTFCTLLPSLWNETILRISTNPNLEGIVLGDGSYRPREHTHTRTISFTGKGSENSDGGSGGIVGTGLFLTQARKHGRLSDLIRAGTSIMRTRAQTMGTTPCHSSSPSTSSTRSPHINYVRSQSMVPTSSGSPPTPSSSSSTASSTVSTCSVPSKSQKPRQRQGDNRTEARMWNSHHNPSSPKCESVNLSRGSCASPPRSLMSQAI